MPGAFIIKQNYFGVKQVHKNAVEYMLIKFNTRKIRGDKRIKVWKNRGLYLDIYWGRNSEVRGCARPR